MKILPFLNLIILLNAPLYAQVATEKDKAQIETLINESFDQIWSALDSKNIQKFYTHDFLLLENGEVWNNDSIAYYLDNAILQKPFPKRENTINIIDTKITGKTAWVAYHNAALITVKDKIIRKTEWLESATAILTADGWKLDMLHSTRTKNE